MPSDGQYFFEGHLIGTDDCVGQILPLGQTPPSASTLGVPVVAPFLQ